MPCIVVERTLILEQAVEIPICIFSHTPFSTNMVVLLPFPSSLLSEACSCIITGPVTETTVTTSIMNSTTSTETITTSTTSTTATMTMTTTSTTTTQNLGQWFTIFQHLVSTTVSPIGLRTSTTAVSTVTTAIPSHVALDVCSADCLTLTGCTWLWFYTDQTSWICVLYTPILKIMLMS